MKKFEQEMDKRLGTGIKDDKSPPVLVCIHEIPHGKPCALCPGGIADKPPISGAGCALVEAEYEVTVKPLVPLAHGQVPLRRMATSLNPKIAAEGLLAYRAQQDKDFAGDDWINKEILVEHWLMHDYPHTDEETGEVSDRVRTVLITPDGQRYGFSSVGIANSVRAICEFVRPAPWRPPIKVRLVAKRSSAEKRYFTLDLIG